MCLLLSLFTVYVTWILKFGSCIFREIISFKRCGNSHPSTWYPVRGENFLSVIFNPQFQLNIAHSHTELCYLCSALPSNAHTIHCGCDYTHGFHIGILVNHIYLYVVCVCVCVCVRTHPHPRFFHRSFTIAWMWWYPWGMAGKSLMLSLGEVRMTPHLPCTVSKASPLTSMGVLCGMAGKVSKLWSMGLNTHDVHLGKVQLCCW